VKSALAILLRGLRPRRLAVFIPALLLLGFGCYGWLRLPDSSGFYLFLQAVLGVVLLAAAGALAAGAVANLEGEPGWAGIRQFRRRAPIGALVLIVAALLYWLSGLLEGAGAKRIYVVASWLSYHFNHPVPIPPLRTAWEILFLFVYLVLLPALAIGVLATWLRRHSRKSITGEAVLPTGNAPAEPAWHPNFFLFWAVAIVLAVLFDWLPWQLAWWVPQLDHGWAEMLSAVLRLGIAGFAFACGLLIQWSWYVGNESAPAVAIQPSQPPASAD
jgi:hypothetical protein